jgi:hypothetical protein
MKKVLLTMLLISLLKTVYSQNINLGNEKFIFQGQEVNHYGVGWYGDAAAAAYGPMLYISSFGGTRFFAGGLLKATLDYNGNFGINTEAPSKKLDIGGDILLRNLSNNPGAGASISFSSYDLGHIGPKISSYLDFASGVASSSRLILSSYNNGYMNEITLVGGRVGIGTLNPREALSVNGSIRAKQITVETANWPDYVFDTGYKMLSVPELESYLLIKKHLPNMLSAEEIKEQGQNLGEVNAKLLKNVEELTLRLIEKDKQLREHQKRISAQDQRMDKLERSLNNILKSNRVNPYHE